MDPLKFCFNNLQRVQPIWVKMNFRSNDFNLVWFLILFLCVWHSLSYVSRDKSKMKNQTSLKPFDLKSILTYNTIS